MKSLFFLITGAAAFGFIGYFLALVYGGFVCLLTAYWRDSILARIYYGVPVLTFSITILLYLNGTIQKILKGGSIDLPEISIYGGFIGGIGTYLWSLWAAFNSVPRRQPTSLLGKPHEPKSSGMHMVIDKIILLLSWISIVMLFVYSIFFSQEGLTWLSQWAIIFFVAALLLLAFRRVFLKQRHEPKWNADKE
jgi:hypothetical protein